MKIAIFVDNLTVFGGTQKTTLMTYHGLNNKKHDVQLVTLAIDRKNCFPELSEHLKIDATFTKISETKRKIINSSSMLVLLFKAILFGFKSPKYLKWADAIIIEDLSCLVCLSVLPTRKVKIIWYLNNQLPDDIVRVFSSYKISLIDKLKRFILNRAFSKVDVFATYDKYNQNLLRKIGYYNTKVVYVGADSIVPDLKKQRNWKKSKKINLLSIGGLYPHRRYEDIIKALKLLRGEGIIDRLYILGSWEGSPDYYEKLNNLVKKMKLTKKVVLIPYMLNEDKADLLSNMDIFVFVNDANSWGISTVEAMAVGIPVLITNNIGAADLINKNDVLIVKPRSPSEIAKALKVFYYNQKEMRRKALVAHKEVSKTINWDSYVHRISELLR